LPASSMPLPAEHLDPETVAGFSARTLNAKQRSLVFEHLAGCESCRAWIAANAEISEPAACRLPLPWGVLAAGVALACVAGWQLLTPSQPHGPLATSAPASSKLASKEDMDEPASTASRRTPQPHHVSAQRVLPGALRQVRLAPGRVPMPALNEISLQTTVGEKWIRAGGFLEPTQTDTRVDLSQRLLRAGTFRVRIVPTQPLAELNLRIGSQAVDQPR